MGKRYAIACAPDMLSRLQYQAFPMPCTGYKANDCVFRQCAYDGAANKPSQAWHEVLHAKMPYIDVAEIDKSNAHADKSVL